MKHETTNTLNELNGNIAKAKEVKSQCVLSINNNMQDVIAFLIDEGKNDQSLAMLSGKNRNKAICLAYLASDSVMVPEVKRSIKVAYAIFDGYKLRKELLSISKMEQLISLDKSEVNELMNCDTELYLDAVKDLINSKKVEKSVKVFVKPKTQK